MDQSHKQSLSQGGTERFLAIDGLRGVAALSVLIFHLIHSGPQRSLLIATGSFPMDELSRLLRYGVMVFFVLSGFVIAHSLRNNPLTSREVGAFVLRRQLRLDPPYWCAGFFALVLWWCEVRFTNYVTKPLPDLAGIGLNMVYLHPFFHEPPILQVAWTLCLEVQFYLFFILFLYATRSMPQARYWRLGLLMAANAISILVWLSGYTTPWFFPHWFTFGVGVLAYWAGKGAPEKWCAGVTLAAVLALAGIEQRADLAVCFATAAFLWLAQSRQALSRWLGWKSLLYLGRVSYSLYLTHLVVINYGLGVAYKLMGKSPAAAWLAVAAVGTGALVFADLFHRWIERPSLALLSKLRSSDHRREEPARRDPVELVSPEVARQN